ncbi:MAG TPA: hypothetical protein VKW04_10065 [Planctomycetota bacterium]|nr:hypothetical protein [Planctomycetota bacterium]
MPAALALSIDCDGCTLERLRRVFRYWTGSGETEFGPGLGLPVASSMFAYSRNPSAPPQAAYFDGDRDGLLEAWGRGWIDSLHGLGDFSAGQPCTRDMAKRAFDLLAADGVKIRVWTNHGGPENVQNLIRPGTVGDVPGSTCYLADLAADYGIRYLWPSELTPVVGQDREASAAEYYAAHADRPGGARLLARLAHGWSEGLVRKAGIEPYPGNRLVEARRLRDGREILTFRRYGRWRFDTLSLLPEILTEDVLDRLVASGGSMIVYLHIGPSADETPDRLRAGMKAMDPVARRVREGVLQVLKTVDLLATSSGQQ